MSLAAFVMVVFPGEKIVSINVNLSFTTFRLQKGSLWINFVFRFWKPSVGVTLFPIFGGKMFLMFSVFYVGSRSHSHFLFHLHIFVVVIFVVIIWMISYNIIRKFWRKQLGIGTENSVVVYKLCAQGVRIHRRFFSFFTWRRESQSNTTFAKCPIIPD